MLKTVNDITQVDRETYQAEVSKAYQEGTNKIRTRLLFSEPVELWQGRRRGYVRAKEHVVKDLFWSNKRGPYYTPTSHRSKGFRLYPADEIKLERVEVLSKHKDYSTQWANIAKSMRKYDINIDVAEAIEAHLRRETEYIDAGLQNRYTRYSRPKKMSFKDVTKGLSMEEMRSRVTKNRWGEYYHMDKPGQKRDRSASLELRKNGWAFYAASEYAGCGNGDYYLMYSPTMAFYTCTD